MTSLSQLLPFAPIANEHFALRFKWAIKASDDLASYVEWKASASPIVGTVSAALTLERSACERVSLPGCFVVALSGNSYARRLQGSSHAYATNVRL